MSGRTLDTAGTVRDRLGGRRRWKPRPALVIQSDLCADLPSVVVCPLATKLRRDADLFRIDVTPSALNGLHQPLQLAGDKITVVPLSTIGVVMGKAEDALLLRVGRALALFQGIA